MKTTITAEIPGHGVYRCSGYVLQRTIEKYLPTSIGAIRVLCEERADVEMGDITDLASFLVMLGDWDAYEYRDEWVETETGWVRAGGR